MEWSNSLLRHFKIQTLLNINCYMAAISAFRVTQHGQIFSLFFKDRIQCIALYQLHNSKALVNLRRGYFRVVYFYVVVIGTVPVPELIFSIDTAPCCACLLHKNSLRKFSQSIFTYLLKAQLKIWELTPVSLHFFSMGRGVTTTAVVT